MEMMSGFPPPEQARVTLANWQDPGSVRWAFRHMREIVPTQVIPSGGGPATPLPAGPALDLASIPVTTLSGAESGVQDVINATSTDAFLVLHRGRLLTERYYAGCTEATPHLLMSVSKSIVGCV